MNGLNTILLVVDSLRADHLGCYGYKRRISPNMDQWAKKCVVFENAISAGTWTVPSVASLFTSLYPSVHEMGLKDGNAKLDDSKTSLASILNDNGHFTMAFTGGGYVDAELGYDHGFEKFKSTKYFLQQFEYAQGGRLDQIGRDFFDTIENIEDRRFFAYLHVWDVHEPFLAHKKELDRLKVDYSGKLEKLRNNRSLALSKLGSQFGCRDVNSFYVNIINKGKINLEPEDIQYIIDLHDNEISFFDQSFGRFIDQLSDKGLLENSVVIVIADHGNELLERGRIGHGGPPYESLIRIPLLIHTPNKLRIQPRSINLPVSTIDILPTILDLNNVEIPKKIQGISLLPAIRHDQQLIENSNGNGLDRMRPILSEDVSTKALCLEDWKLIVRQPQPIHKEDTFGTVQDSGAPALKVMPSEPGGGIKINFKNYFLHKGVEVDISASLMGLNENQTLSIGIKGTSVMKEFQIDKNWLEVGIKKTCIPKDILNNQFLLELHTIDGRPFLVKEISMTTAKEGIPLFLARFEDIYFPVELYNLRVDPHERINLLFQESEKCKSMTSTLRGIVHSNDNFSTSFQENEDITLSEGIQKRLRTLGYMD